MLSAAFLFIILLIITIILSLFYVIPFFYGAPFEPSHKKQLQKIIEFADVKKNEKIAELGSGDGRIVIELAKKGAIAHGFEINPLLVLYSRKKIKEAKLEKNAFIHWKNFWKTNLNTYDTIVLFQFKTIMKKLEKKLKNELKPNSKIISNEWKFPNFKLIKRKNKISLYKI